MTVMKVTVAYDGGGVEAHRTDLKITLPRKWKEGEVVQIKDFFVGELRKKHPEKAIEADKMHLVDERGKPVADNAIVFHVLGNGAALQLRAGAAPVASDSELAAAAAKSIAAAEEKGVGNDAAKAAAGNAVSAPSAVPKANPAGAPAEPIKLASTLATPESSDGNVGSKAAIEAAREVKKSFDYSKWDRLDLSDDDGEDCHPNIDKASWVRLMGQKRKDRREKEEEKIKAYNSKIEKYTKRVAEVQERIDGGDDDPQLLVDLRDAKDNLESYKAKLERFIAHRKLTADDLCEVSEDKTVVAATAEIAPLVDPSLVQRSSQSPQVSTIKPEKPRDEGLEYDEYIKVYRTQVDKFASLRSDEVSEQYLLEHPELLHEHGEGYLLLLTLDTCMKHLDEKTAKGDKWKGSDDKRWEQEELAVARQHLLIQFIQQLSKGRNVDPRDMIKPFFRRTSKNSEDRVDGFEDDLKAFVGRIRNRAAEKISKGEPSPLAGPVHNADAGDDIEYGYEPAPLGPGGLDPNEVLKTLPEDMQDAFINQDTEKLKACLMSMPEETANHYMQQCIDSGLWRPGPSDLEEE